MGDIIRIQKKSGGYSYKARVRRKGYGLTTKTFSRKTDAKQWISHVEGQLLEGKGLPKRKRNTVGDAIDRYIEEILPQKKLSTQKSELPRILTLRKLLGDILLQDVDYQALSKAKEWLLTTPVKRIGHEKEQMRGPATVNRFFGILRHIFSIACRDWEWIENNPVSRIRPLREPNARDRIVSDSELKVILEALATHPRKDFQLIVQIALVTGCRRGNAQSVHWEHIDFEARTMTFPDTKNNHPHVALMTEELAKDLKQYQIETHSIGGPAFPSKPGSHIPYVDVKQVWRRFVKGLGIEALRFHDLRHSVASYLAQQNVSLVKIGRLLGHKSLESTKRYAHISTSDVTEQTEILGNRIRSAK